MPPPLDLLCTSFLKVCANVDTMKMLSFFGGGALQACERAGAALVVQHPLFSPMSSTHAD